MGSDRKTNRQRDKQSQRQRGVGKRDKERQRETERDRETGRDRDRIGSRANQNHLPIFAAKISTKTKRSTTYNVHGVLSSYPCDDSSEINTQGFTRRQLNATCKTLIATGP